MSHTVYQMSGESVHAEGTGPDRPRYTKGHPRVSVGQEEPKTPVGGPSPDMRRNENK